MTENRQSCEVCNSESIEELEKEENGLLGTRKNAEKEERIATATSCRILPPPSKDLVPFRKTLQIFLFGFATNFALVLVAMLFFHHPPKESSSATIPATKSPISPIQTPLFLNDTTSFAFLLDSNGGFEYSGDYFLLQQGFEAQMNQAYCGVASVTTVLNSFRNQVTLPVDYEYDPYPYATQEDVFDECVNQNVVLHDDDFDGIFAFPYGLGMGQVTALAKCFFSSKENWQVHATHVDPSEVSLEQMRSDLIGHLEDKNARVIVNFQRSVVHEEGGGHYSPIGSYSTAIDAFLLLDVAKYKYPATWVPAQMLYKAMATTDSCGYWNFPFGQNDLSDELLYPENSDSYKEAAKQLACQETFRGYLSVRRTVL